ncbi:protein E6-like [Magnolia sinica]|uniref:protein E6-like n=1 Tax=Magnolia sinica TaxID=86752 RepID=UPI0026581190|nr:protein E6-like [Magnolia sinica]
MATFPKPLLSLILLILISSLQIQARDSQFFGKVSRYNTVQETESVEKQVPTPKQEDVIPQSRHGYGLYGHDSEKFTPTTTNSNSEFNTVNSPSKFSTEEYNGSNSPSKYSTEEYPNDQTYKNKESTTTYPNSQYENEQTYKNKESTTSYPNTEFENEQRYKNKEFTNSYPNSQYENEQSYKNKESTTSYPNSQYENEQRYKNKESTTSYPNSQYENEQRYKNKESTTSYPNNQQYGMSDTRFLEHGKYYYNVNANDNYRNGYVSGKGINQGYESSTDVDPKNKYNNRGYYGNNENAYEYNNSMEGQQNREDENEEEFLP